VATFDVQFAVTVGVARIIEGIESLTGVRRVRVARPL
jgi:hypothetical protein